MEQNETEILHTLALTYVEGVGPSKAKNLIAFCGSAEAIFKEKKAALLKVPDIGPVTAASLRSDFSLDRAKAELEFARRYDVHIVLFHSREYPERLKMCDDSPILLFSKGNFDLNPKFALSVVGTRTASSYGKQMCQELLSGLSHLKPLVVSGLAYGIDICAHRSAMQYKLPTVACLAHGLDRIYPPLHTTAAKEMLYNGGLLTEFPSGTNPDRELFPTRNRIIAGLSDCTIVVETDKSGGSIITANIANSYGREVFAYPGRANDQNSTGCNTLIRRNLAAILNGPEDLIEYMNWNLEAVGVNSQLELFSDLTQDELLIAELLKSRGRLPVDRISNELNLGLTATSSLLLELEFKGVVRSLPGKIYEIVSSLTIRV